MAEQYGKLGAIIISIDNNADANTQTAQELKDQGIKIYQYS